MASLNQQVVVTNSCSWLYASHILETENQLPVELNPISSSEKYQMVKISLNGKF